MKSRKFNGQGGIRTPGSLAGTPVFKTDPAEVRPLAIACDSRGTSGASGAARGDAVRTSGFGLHSLLHTAPRDGLVRWVVFQTTSRARFRLTQWLFAADKPDAEAAAAIMYAGCAGTLAVQSFAEYQAALDDLDALRRTRVSPKEPGQRRPNVRRGVSYGYCVCCGAVTSARGGRAPKYCPTHRERKYQRAYRTGTAVIGSIARAAVVCEAPRRQAVGA